MLVDDIVSMTLLTKALQCSAHTSGTEQAIAYANSSPSAILRTYKTSL